MGFLGRAKKMMRGQAASEPPRPQYYSVACVEGHIVRGQRTDGYQAIRCPSCGEGIFVLPRSPLPQPVAPSTHRSRPRPVKVATPVEEEPIALADAPPQEEEAIAEIEWVDHDVEVDIPPPDEAEPEVPQPAKPVQPRAPRPKPAAKAAPPPSAEPQSPPRPKSAPKKRPGEPVAVVVATKKRSPHLYLLAGVIVLVVATVGFRLWKQRPAKSPPRSRDQPGGRDRGPGTRRGGRCSQAAGYRRPGLQADGRQR